MQNNLRTKKSVRLAIAALIALLGLMGTSQAGAGPAVVSADRGWCC